MLGGVDIKEKLLTNIFIIENLDELKCDYRKYLVKGLLKNRDYEKNLQILIDKISRKTKSPCIMLKEDDSIYIAQLNNYKKLPEEFGLIGLTVNIELQKGINRLDFVNLTSDYSNLAIRFLQFIIQGQLRNFHSLWQPRSGGKLYNINPDQRFKKKSKKIDLFRGFKFRVVSIQNKLGICIDTITKYMSKNYIPSNLDQDTFDKYYKGKRCMYEYSNNWYEVTLASLHDLDISNTKLTNGEFLYNQIIHEYSHNKESIIRRLPKNCSVLNYITSTGENRFIPTVLCRLTYRTDHSEVSKYHSWSLKIPFRRLNDIKRIRKSYFNNLEFNGITLKLTKNPFEIAEEKFKFPDLEFGNKAVLTCNKLSSTQAHQTTFKEFPRKKKELFYKMGPYKKDFMYRQYFFVPDSLNRDIINIFMTDIKRIIEKLFKSKSSIRYNPEIIYYDDSSNTIYGIAKEILDKVDILDLPFGYALVIIPRIRNQKKREEDVLANILMRKLSKREEEIFVSIIHTNFIQNLSNYYNGQDYDSILDFITDKDLEKKYKGYLENVAVNKILLLNNLWPFILKTSTKSDLTIGIDVKNNTAGFTLIYQNGKDIRPFTRKSGQKEQLNKSYLGSIIMDILNEEQTKYDHRILRNIVIHRDGNIFMNEMEGIKNAIKQLKKKIFYKNLIPTKIINQNCRISFLEIKKSSTIPLRIFKQRFNEETSKTYTYNPDIGTYLIMDDYSAFICNTGYPYKHPGTTNPLHIFKKGGPLSIKDLLQDVFLLANLTWTKIDDCSRYPITIRMTDIILRETAGEFDENKLIYGEDYE